MELRTYLDVLRRRRWLVAAITAVVAVLAGGSSLLRTPMYRADAQLLLRPNDPTEQLESDGRYVLDADRYLTAQIRIIKSESVGREAAKEIPGSVVDELLDQVAASQWGTSDIVKISATDSDPARATKVANAFARAYFENRRQFAVEGLDRAVKELNTKLAELQARIGELDERITGNPGPLANGEALRAARAAATVQYETLYSRQQELLIDKSLKRGEAELIAEAKTPTSPTSPRPKRDAALGGFLGLLLGLGIAFSREQLDERLRNRQEAQTATGLPVLAELPYDEESATEPRAVGSQLRPSGALAEAARGLRTSLMFLGVDQPARSLVVTSAGSGEGKSLVAANLATVYAQAGMRTILVSADLRRPRLDEMFAVPFGTPGLSDVILSLSRVTPGSKLQDVIIEALLPTSAEGLFLLSAGKLPPNPAELLGSRRAALVFEALSILADVVVIDTPPVLAVTDAAVLAPRADGVLLVASQGQTHKDALTRATAMLGGSRARVLGLVLNKVDTTSRYVYGRYDRGYYSAYQPPHRSRIPWKAARR